MSSLHKPPPDLLSLPNEILARICFYAEDGDDYLIKSLRWLKAVRPTCKQLYVPATTEFVKQYLKRPEVSLSRHGLQEFVELCKHPLFGPHVQHISFDSCRLDSKFVQNIGAQMDSLITENKLEAVKQAEEYLDWYLLKLEEELRFEESGDMAVLLKQAFEALRMHGNSIGLTALVSDNPFNLDFHSKTALSSLETLDLSIGEHDYVKDVDKTLEAFVSQAKGLKRFDLMVIESEDHEEADDRPSPSESIEYASQIIRILNSDALRWVWLADVTIFEVDLITMLTGHQSTLKEVVLSDVTLAGAWDGVLLCLRDKLSLERFVIVGARQTHGDDLEEGSYGGFWVDGGVELNGDEEITSRLTDVLSQKSRQRTDADFRPNWECANSMWDSMTMAHFSD
ncbi:hypothetical protein KCU77_g1114, partial [Aureobasidium melanogenum]